MWTLILKDLEQHHKTILLLFLSAAAFPATFSLFMDERQDGAAYLGVTFGYTVLGAPAMLAFWCIGQEKLKGTFKLLTILPISRRRIIQAKSLTITLVCLLIVNLVSALGPMIMRLAPGKGFSAGLRILFWMNLMTIFFIGVDVAIFTLMDARTASQIIYLGHALLALGAIVSNKLVVINDQPLWIMPRLDSAGLQLSAGALILFLVWAMVDGSGRLFEMKEWADLEET